MSATAFPAWRFDGCHADAVAVRVRVEGHDLIVETADGRVLDRAPLDRVAVSEPFDHTPRMIGLPNEITLEVHARDANLAGALGVRLPLAVRLQRRWLAVLAMVAAIVGLVALGYMKGLPAAARWVAFALPPRLEHRMGEQFLVVLDKHHFSASRLDPARRAQITERFARAAAAAAPGVAYRLEFRMADKNEVNAMALPGGIIVLLDGLVTAADDDEVLAVLGHELGHVVAKHSARRILQSVGIGTLAGLLWGDFSGVAASVPVALGVLHYSREFELEADDFAVTLLATQSLTAEPLYDFFLWLLEQRRDRRRGQIPIFLSTHPSTEERLDRLHRRLHE